MQKGEYSSNLIISVWYGENGIVKNNTKYTYDNKGNILSIIENGKETIRYSYDDISRIIREDNKTLNKTFTFAYDKGGNIIKREEFTYTLKPTELLENGNEFVFNYPSHGWKDQLMEYNGENFKYDCLGNPVVYRSKKLKWGNLRNLEESDINESGSPKATYTYNSNGIRTSKVVDGVETKFYLTNNKIVTLNNDGTFIYFYYGVDGLLGFNFDNTANYYYKKNIQGDILTIFDKNGQEIVRYIYDAWGKHEIKVRVNNG